MQGSPLSGREAVRVRWKRQLSPVYHVNKALKIAFTILHSLELRDMKGKRKSLLFLCDA